MAMFPSEKGKGNYERRPRLWPGIIAVVLQWIGFFAVPFLAPDFTLQGIIAGLAAGFIFLVWWLFFSRVPIFERWAAVALMIVVIPLTTRILDKSIATAAMGVLFGFLVIPTLSLALVAWAMVGSRFGAGPRRATLVAAIAAGSGVWTLVRTEGITGGGRSQLAWRWTKTSEQKLLAQSNNQSVSLKVVPQAPPTASPTPEKKESAEIKDVPGEKHAPAAPTPEKLPTTPPPAVLPSAHVTQVNSIDWPGFRGPHRDDVVTGVRIKTDWASSPPVELWRRQVGPGWSSFAVRNGLLYTQEQRGDFEVVSCYNVNTGEPVWIHRDATRFWESNAGAGPRSTPTLHKGRVYTLGATGILNALDAGSGAVIWTRNAASDTDAKTPEWGFSSSPLVVDDLVIVAASGRLAAYDLATGSPRWQGPKDLGGSYSSPHLFTIGGVPQVVLLTSIGATSVAPADGKVLWKHSWPGTTILQPALTADGGVLMTTDDMGGGIGVRRLSVAHEPSGWTAEEMWTSPGLKPYFNDFVVNRGHAYGFDGSILSCIDLQDGKRKWKGGRYGHGQMLLLADQDLLIVLAEEGELALVAAAPSQFTEIARFPALEGKTWNHPVLAGDILLVRNDRQMIAFRLSPAGT